MWLIPCKDITGEGIIVDVYGFSVAILEPQAHEMLKLINGKTNVAVRANVMMMCGCPIKPGGIWDANKYEVKAIVKINDVTSKVIPLAFANKTSTFEGMIEATKEGIYEVTVYSFDPLTGNSGVDRTTFIVGK